MSRPIKIFIGLLFAMVLLAIALISMPVLRSFVILQTGNIASAGTWEDDPKNWSRAFNEEQPAHVKVVHSKYWKSNHVTEEFIYFFEVKTSPEWRDAFLKKHDAQPVPASEARNFRTNNHSAMTPDWFAPDFEQYEVWDKPGHFGSIWINKANGHIHFYGVQL